jgi:hypothetical protein
MLAQKCCEEKPKLRINISLCDSCHSDNCVHPRSWNVSINLVLGFMQGNVSMD